MMTWLKYDSNAAVRRGSKRHAIVAKVLKRAAIAGDELLRAIRL
jgi:hypothetical protein